MSHELTPTPLSNPAVSELPTTELAPVRPQSKAAASLRRARRGVARLASDVGQGTVEYVGLLLLMATVLAAVVTAANQLGGKDEIGKRVVNQIGRSIDKAGGGER